MLQNYAYLLFIKYLSKCSPKFRSKYINGISNVGRYNDLFTYSAFPRKRKWIVRLLLPHYAQILVHSHSLENSQLSGVTNVYFSLIDTDHEYIMVMENRHP